MRDGLEALAKMTTLARLKGAERVVAVATSAVREAANGARLPGPRQGADRARRPAPHRRRGRAADLPRGARGRSTSGRAPRSSSTSAAAARSGSPPGRASAEQVVSLSLGSLRCAAVLKGDPPGAAAVDRLRRRDGPASRRGRAAAGRCERLVATSGTAVCCADLVDYFAGRPWKECRAACARCGPGTSALSGAPARPQAAADRRPAAGGRAALGEPARRRRAAPGAGRPRRASTASRSATGRCARGWCSRPWASPCPPARDARGPAPPPGAPARRAHRERLPPQPADAPAWPSACSTSPPRSTASARREREWLEYAALLHDIGYSIHYRNHHKHAYYLITNAVLDAFDQREIEIIAHVARYHRGAAPKPQPPHARAAQALAAADDPQARRAAAGGRRPRPHPRLARRGGLRLDPSRRVTLEVLSRYEVGPGARGRPRARPASSEKVFGCRPALRQGLEVAAG